MEETGPKGLGFVSYRGRWCAHVRVCALWQVASVCSGRCDRQSLVDKKERRKLGNVLICSSFFPSKRPVHREQSTATNNPKHPASAKRANPPLRNQILLYTNISDVVHPNSRFRDHDQQKLYKQVPLSLIAISELALQKLRSEKSYLQFSVYQSNHHTQVELAISSHSRSSHLFLSHLTLSFV